MCLAVPMKVLRIDDNVVRVAIGGVEREVRLDIVDRYPEIGDYVIVHAGFAIRMIEEEEARITLSYFEEMLPRDAEASE
jgi:hydrogenase expression/formation protein HypC